jgi:hypothetical protein
MTKFLDASLKNFSFESAGGIVQMMEDHRTCQLRKMHPIHTARLYFDAQRQLCSNKVVCAPQKDHANSVP